MTANVQTLTESFTAGRMPWNDALRYGAQIIDSLRHAHDEGRCHGALTPDAVILSATGVELVPAPAGEPVRVTAYTAPERLAGGAPDARADIFSLGALLYEMFTGRRAFSGETPEELAAAIENSIPEPIGDTGLDRLVSNCLVKDPAGRWQRLQQVHMEFRILTFSAKRAQQLSAPRQHFALQADLRKVEDQLSARIDQQWAEAAAGLRQVSAELPLLESQLAVRLDQQAAETAAALRHISAELPLMESHLASGLAERFGEAMSALQHLAAELPLVEGRFASRLEQQDGALARAQESIAELPQLESRLTARIEQNESALAGVPEIESRLSSRLEQNENALTGVQQSIAELPQLESRLTARIDQHENTLAGVPEIESRLSSRLEQNENALTGVQQSIAELPQLESRLTARIDQHENTLAGVPEIESRLSSRLEQQNVLVESLQQAAAEQRTVVETVSRSVASVEERIVSLDAKFCATYESAQHAERAASQFAEMQSSLIEELREIGTTVKSHTAAIESIRTSMARTDDFMERIVEALESLQSMVLDPARDRVGA
jgi:chromosome segregation ATPase